MSQDDFKPKYGRRVNHLGLNSMFVLCIYTFKHPHQTHNLFMLYSLQYTQCSDIRFLISFHSARCPALLANVLNSQILYKWPQPLNTTPYLTETLPFSYHICRFIIDPQISVQFTITVPAGTAFGCSCQFQQRRGFEWAACERLI